MKHSLPTTACKLLWKLKPRFQSDFFDVAGDFWSPFELLVFSTIFATRAWRFSSYAYQPVGNRQHPVTMHCIHGLPASNLLGLFEQPHRQVGGQRQQWQADQTQPKQEIIRILEHPDGRIVHEVSKSGHDKLSANVKPQLRRVFHFFAWTRFPRCWTSTAIQALLSRIPWTC
jgi:hypothetical protein